MIKVGLLCFLRMLVTLPLTPKKERNGRRQSFKVFVGLHRRGHHSLGNSRTTRGKEIALRNTKMHTFNMISFITQIVTEELHKAAPRSEKGSLGGPLEQREREPEV